MKNFWKVSITLFVITIISFISINFLVYPHSDLALAQSPNGYSDIKSPMTDLANSSNPNSTTNTGYANMTSSSGVRYAAKFECGSIIAGEGPLRPGHYDTDMSIFNKQAGDTTLIWNLVVNNGPTSNGIMVTMKSEMSTGITCKDVRKVLSDYNDEFLEGFIIINVPFNSGLQSKSSVISGPNNSDPLDVQAFYTANALDRLPQEVVVDKISFYIIQDGSGKIPADMFRKTLDISIPSTLDKISNTEMKVKGALAKQYNLTDSDLSKIVIRIKDVSVGVGVFIDDHAISLVPVRPQPAT